jgi:3-dehydroquinate synthase
MNGFAEILKMGLILDRSIWDLARQNMRNQELIFKAMQGKISIVEQDPTERGLRRILNFGHTIGHALEKIAHYEMPHGEAVAIGCQAEAHLSMSLGYLSPEDFEQIRSPYSIFSLKLPSEYTKQSLFQAMSHDKKTEQGKVRFVLIDKIGHALPFDGAYCRPVTEQELEPTLHWMEARYG